MKNIVNIITFVRGIEPRPGRDIDLVLPVSEQLRLLREHDLRGTVLLQYDALICPSFVSLVKDYSERVEVGLWLEVVEPQVKEAGGEWRGRYPWDWYNDVGFLIGYEPDVRKRLIDVAMEKFKDTFGAYPRSVGAWHLDAVSLQYLAEHYRVDAACICRDQVGTDGYTMQGGYYNQAYYPARNNMFCPAGSRDEQIDLPVFRMLGSDPILAYDYQIFAYDNEKGPTLEPAQRGRNATFCDWFFDEVMGRGRGLSFGYTQTGQENSFGWPRMRDGILHQFCRIKELSDKGIFSVETLGESGRWYKQQFDLTPPSTYCALSSWDGADRKSVWYSSRRYRANVMWENGALRLRDLYLFDGRYRGHYLTHRCDTHACEFRNLPVMDGTLYSTVEHPAGVYFTDGTAPIRFDTFDYAEGDGCATVTLRAECGEVCLTFFEERITLSHTLPRLVLKAEVDEAHFYGRASTADGQFANHNNTKTSITYVTRVAPTRDRITFTFDGFDYAIEAETGHFEDARTLLCKDNAITLVFPLVGKEDA